MSTPAQLDIFTTGPRGSVLPREHACGPACEREDATIAERFEAWIAARPEFFAVFRQVAESERAQGYRTGAKAIVEHMRSRRLVATEKDGKFKYDNSYTALLARRLIEVDPSFAEHFELRERRPE